MLSRDNWRVGNVASSQSGGGGGCFVITGATGYIGGHIARELTSFGNTVTVLTRDLNKAQCKAAGNQNVTYLPFDLSYPATLEHIRDQIKGATLIDVAWEFDGKTDRDQVYEHLELAKNCIRFGISKIMAAGSLFEFDFNAGQVSENSIRSGTTPYGLAKIGLHDSLETLTNKAGVPFLWARFHYVHGNDEVSRSVFGRILREPRPFQITPRDGLYDFIEVTLLAQQVRRSLEANATGVLDFGSGQAQSFTRALTEWLQIRGLSASDYLVDPGNDNAIQQGTWPDLSKLSHLLGGSLAE